MTLVINIDVTSVLIHKFKIEPSRKRAVWKGAAPAVPPKARRIWASAPASAGAEAHLVEGCSSARLEVEASTRRERSGSPVPKS